MFLHTAHRLVVGQTANTGSSTNSVSRAHASQCQKLSLKCPPPGASAARRQQGPTQDTAEAPLPLAVPSRWRHPTCPKAPLHPSPPVLYSSRRQSQNTKTLQSWISSRVAGSSAFPTNLGVQSLYRRLILRSYTVFLKCTPTLYGSESSATHEFGDI